MPLIRESVIEEMPLGATLHAIELSDGRGWDGIAFKPSRVEIHSDVITLLGGAAGAFRSGSTYGVEININRGTKVKYSTNC